MIPFPKLKGNFGSLQFQGFQHLFKYHSNFPTIPKRPINLPSISINRPDLPTQELLEVHILGKEVLDDDCIVVDDSVDTAFLVLVAVEFEGDFRREDSLDSTMEGDATLLLVVLDVVLVTDQQVTLGTP
jgi:hypothetical protein